MHRAFKMLGLNKLNIIPIIEMIAKIKFNVNDLEILRNTPLIKSLFRIVYLLSVIYFNIQ